MDTYVQNGVEYAVKGNALLVEIEGVQKTIGSGIIELPEDNIERLMLARMTGFIRAIGKEAWSDKKEPYAALGDKVVFKRYAGNDVNRTTTGSLSRDEPLLRTMEDYEILCVIRPLK